MPRRLERQHAEQHRDREAAPARTADAPRANIASTCSSEYSGWVMIEVRSGRQLALQPIPLGRRVGGRGVERAGDRERGRLADRRPGSVLAPVEAGQDRDQPDRIDVPDAGRDG